MSAPIWPLSLPQKPSSSSYKESRPFDVTETEMDEGLKSRAKARISPYEFTCKYELTEQQWNVLDNFVTNVIRDGLIGFDFPKPTTGEYVRVSLKPTEEFAREPFSGSIYWEVTLVIRMYRYANPTT